MVHLKVLIFGLMLLGIRAEQVDAGPVNDYINKLLPYARFTADSFGVPVSVILAIAIVESGAGNSTMAKVMHNHFGLKAGKKWRNCNGMMSRYRCYSTDSAGVVDFGMYLSRRKFYVHLKGNFDYNAWVKAISQSGYSTKPVIWRNKILTTISKYELFKL